MDECKPLDDGTKSLRGCLNCSAQETPQWRAGPDGPKTLCNKCGSVVQKRKRAEEAAAAGRGSHSSMAKLKT